MVCGTMLQSGHSGEGWCASSTLCKYDMSMGDLFALSCARVRRVSLLRVTSVGQIWGGWMRRGRRGLGLSWARWVWTMLEWMSFMLVVICADVMVSGSVLMCVV